MEKRIKELIIDKISGEWGEEAAPGEGVAIIRTANFSNEGVIDFEKLVYRKIDSKKIEAKRLYKGDIIIEKSGGSPTQPVGRVVYFDLDTNEDYLCNNFTSVLRPDVKLVYPKYLFYQLLIAHSRGKTLKYQNKTTGIINLKLDNYLNEKIYVPSLPDQIRIATLLSKAEALIKKRKESIEQLDEFVKSVFAEMFGDPVKNEKGWEIDKFSKSLYDIVAGSSSSNESKYHDTIDTEVGILKVSAVTKGVFNPEEIKVIRWSQLGNTLLNPQEGDLLFSRANTRELVGATCIVNKNYPDLYIPDKIWVLMLHDSLHNKYFVHHTFQNNTFRKELTKGATGSSGSMLNISMGKLRNVKIPYPPIALQNKFTIIIRKVETLKNVYLQSIRDLESLFGVLSQQAFKGELDLRKIKSKSIDEEIEKALKSTKRTGTVDKQPNTDKKDTRYGDPFEVDEPTAKKQGGWFYNEWLRLHGKTIEEENESVWLQSKRSGLRPTTIKFNSFEGNAIINEVFSKHNTGFGFSQFESALKTEKITYTAKEIKEFIFQKLEQKELVQYYATKEWMEAIRHPKFNPPGGPEFSGEGSIWFLVK